MQVMGRAVFLPADSLEVGNIVQDTVDIKASEVLLGACLLLLIGLGGLLSLRRGEPKVLSFHPIYESHENQQNVPIRMSFFSDLTKLNDFEVERDWRISNFSFPSAQYNTGWSEDHITYSDAGLALMIKKQRGPHHPYTGGEFQRGGYYGYGRYEVIMRPARGSGLVSSFFTYTGPPFGYPHDEIDIEFLGNDTSKAQFNVFVNGEALNPPLVSLGFDASQAYNLYAFEWTQDEVRWYVNDRLVFTVTENDWRIPAYPGKIMVNLWTGKPKLFAWHGRPNFANGVTAEYKCISYQEIGYSTKQCSDKPIQEYR